MAKTNTELAEWLREWVDTPGGSFLTGPETKRLRRIADRLTEQPAVSWQWNPMDMAGTSTGGTTTVVSTPKPQTSRHEMYAVVDGRVVIVRTEVSDGGPIAGDQ